MPETPTTQPRTVAHASRPRLKPFVRLHEDKGRGRTVLLAPEQVLTPNDVALAVLSLCDGVRTVDAIADELAQRYDAHREQIADDIIPVLQDLADCGLLES